MRARMITPNHGYPTVDPLKPSGRVLLRTFPWPNHGYPTVDPLKRWTPAPQRAVGWTPNHGYPTVDPLKPDRLPRAHRPGLPNHGYPTVDPLKLVPGTDDGASTNPNH